MSANPKKTLLIRNGTLIDGSGKAAARNDAVVIEGNRIENVGALPPTLRSRIAATCRWSTRPGSGSCRA